MKGPAPGTTGEDPGPQVIDLGRMSYERAYERQTQCVAETLARRDAGDPSPGVIFLVEHDPPVITLTRRPGVRDHLLADEPTLARSGVVVAQTDRGGDITYHGPGQLVVYPILDLNWYGLNLHAYMRLLEDVVIGACAQFGVSAGREPGATGVWVAGGESPDDARAKICALGVRVRRWVSMHGLALNVTTNLRHFDLIVPCGLTGRAVTSLERELAEACPSMSQVKRAIVERFGRLLAERRASAREADGSAQTTPASDPGAHPH